MAEFLSGDMKEVGENVNNKADRINYLIKQVIISLKIDGLNI